MPGSYALPSGNSGVVVLCGGYGQATVCRAKAGKSSLAGAVVDELLGGSHGRQGAPTGNDALL